VGCGAETLSAADREVIEQAFGCPVFDRYASREFLEIATECPDGGDGLHINPESLVVEVVDRDNQWVDCEQRGRVLITDLHNWVMPFIRYDIGDIAVWGGRCSCGRGFPLLRRIEGRSSECFILPSGRRISSTELTYLIKAYTDVIREYQAVQAANGDVELLIVPDAGFDRGVQTSLEFDLGRFLGNEITSRVRRVHHIAPLRRSGKRAVIRSQVDTAEEMDQGRC
jgi:phenylacetate-CoA ligase